MTPASRTPEGWPNRCPVCGEAVTIDPSLPPGDAPCPRCGCLLWFESSWLDELDFLVPEACSANLGKCTKEEAISRMVESLAESGAITAEVGTDAAELVLKREQVGTTGLGRGFAVPHAKHPDLKRVVGCAPPSSKARASLGRDDARGGPSQSLRAPRR